MSQPSLTPRGNHILTPLSASTTARRERLRFIDLRVERSPSGRIRADVELEWTEGERIIGTADGHASPQGDLRIAASAALHALEQFVNGAMSFELLGIRAMRAFDANVVVAAVSVRRGGETVRRVGCSLAEDHQPVHAAVLAVLNATNRTLGNFIASE